jgi:hypothetical protein
MRVALALGEAARDVPAASAAGVVALVEARHMGMMRAYPRLLLVVSESTDQTRAAAERFNLEETVDPAAPPGIVWIIDRAQYASMQRQGTAQWN